MDGKDILTHLMSTLYFTEERRGKEGLESLFLSKILSGNIH